MDSGSSTMFFIVEFLGFAGLTVALAVHQLWALKKLKLKRLEKERAAETAGAQAG